MTDRSNSPLAIIGMGCLFPKSGHLGEYWSLLKNGTDAITDVPKTHWSPEDYFDPNPKAPDMTYARRGGFLDAYPFPPHDYGIAPNDLEATDTSQLLGLVAAEMALLDAGYGPDREFDRTRVSVILGVTGTLELVIPLGARLGHPHWRRAMQAAGIPDSQIDEAVRHIREAYVPWQENSFPGLLGNVVAGRIANRLNLQGTNCVVDAACASSLSALHLAGLELAARRCDLVVTGGVDTFNDIFMYMCFSKTPALSPTGDARPFSNNADGTILGEGLGLIVLKRLEDAQRDGDRIYAVIRGIGSSSDGKGHAIYAPSAEGQIRCLRAAYEQARTPPSTIELVEAHGTGTKVGDATEIQALTEVYRASRSDGTWCALGSVKSQIGHTKAAAGAAGLIKATLALYHKVLPPTIKVDQPAEKLARSDSPFYINTQKRPWLPRPDHPRRAAVSAFGFGGSNFHCVLEEAGAKKPAIDWDGQTQIVAFHGQCPDAIRDALANWSEVSSWDQVCVKAASSRAAFDPQAPCRLTMVLQKDRESWIQRIDAARELLQRESHRGFAASPMGLFWGRGPASGKLALLFPGQGSQYVGMLRDWACTFPEMLDALAEADPAFANFSPLAREARLSDFIYPPPAFDGMQRERQEVRLRDTRVAQPALGAVCLGALRTLGLFGVKGELAAGHSFGELTALCAAGSLSCARFLELACLRGQFMADCQANETGGMLAIHASLDQVKSLIRDRFPGLTVANINAPNQIVISGSRVDLDRLIAALDQKSIRSTRLSVSAAFHSPMVASAQGPLRVKLEAIELVPAQYEVFANSTAAPYPSDPVLMRDLLAEQLARPVRFVEQVRAMKEYGAATFLEVGPGHVLTRLVEQIARDSPDWVNVDAIAIDSSSGKKPGLEDLATALARLAARGHPVRLDEWQKSLPHAPQSRARGSQFVVPICGANFRKPAKVTNDSRRETAQPRPVPPPLTAKVDERAATVKTDPMIPITTDNHTQPLRLESPKHPTNHRTSPTLHSVSPMRIADVSIDSRIPMESTPLGQALRLTQEGLQVFQRLQEQTAQLHRQFLQQQEVAQQALTRLIEQQQRLLLATVNGTAPPQPLETMVLASVQPAASPPSPSMSVAARAASDVGTSAIPNSPPTPAVARTPAPHGETERAAAAARASTEATPSLHEAVPRQRVQQVLLEVVSEKTGYPVDMLDLSMGLDSDLGIDSIKRVEILSALQERLPEAPPVKPEHLGSLNTLGQIVQFLARADAESSVAAPSTNGHVPSPPANSSPREDIQKVLLEIVSEKTGYPIEMLNLSMGLDADLGIDSIKRVEILSALQERLPGTPTIKPEDLGRLNTLEEIIAFLSIPSAPHQERTPMKTELDAASRLVRQTLESQPLPFEFGRSAPRWPDSGEILVVGGADALADHISEQVRSTSGRVTRRFWDSSPENEGPIGGVILVAPRLPTLDLPRSAFRWIRHAARNWANTQNRFVMSIARIDGEFGLSGQFAEHLPLDAGLAGLVKTLHREVPSIRCYAVDVHPDVDSKLAASQIVSWIGQETPIEIGLTLAGWQSLRVVDASIGPIDQKLFSDRDVLLVTGGARGVTAAVALEIARRYRPQLVLLGRTDLPEAEPAWLSGARSERDIKQAIAHQHPDWSPRRVGHLCREILAAREIRENLDQIRRAGAFVQYHSVDVRDRDELAGTLVKLRREFGKITGLIHGAGVIEDRLIVDKTDEQFEDVLSTKVVGLVNLLDLLNGDSLRAMVLFSSSTGRFGRKGQCDYAAANEILNKVARWYASRRSECRVVSINWGPWEGGMVTPELRKVFAAEGIGLIPLRSGAEYLLAELSTNDGAIESVVMAQAEGAEGPPVESHAQSQSAAAMELVWQRTVRVATHPVLESHVLDGRAVLPFALHLEWLAHAAMHGQPGVPFVGWEDAKILHGVKLDGETVIDLQAYAGRPERRDGTLRSRSELRSRPQSSGRDVIFSKATVLLGKRPESERPRSAIANNSSQSIIRLSPYDLLFHGEQLHAIEQVLSLTDHAIEAIVRCAPPPSQWFHEPLRTSWLADPLALDAAFQLAVLWSIQKRGVPVLPTTFRRYQQFVARFPNTRVRVVCEVAAATALKLKAQIEWFDDANEVVARLEDAEFVGDSQLSTAFRRNRLARSSPVKIS